MVRRITHMAISAPMGMSEVLATATGYALGKPLGNAFLEKHPQVIQGDITEEKVIKVFTTMMTEICKEVGKSGDYLEEFDAEEDRGTSLFPV